MHTVKYMEINVHIWFFPHMWAVILLLMKSGAKGGEFNFW